MRRAAPGATRRCFRNSTPSISRRRSCRKRGTAVCGRADHLQGPCRGRARHRDLQGCAEGVGAKVEGAFLPVVAPASARRPRRNEHYKSDEEFLFALAAALREEYKAIVDAGSHPCRSTTRSCRTMYDVAARREERARGRKWAEVRIDALEPRARPACPRTRCAITSAGAALTRPHVSDVALKDIVDLVLKVKAGAYSHRDGQPAPRARMARVGGPRSCRKASKLVPGVDQPFHQRGRAPRTGGRAASALRQAGRAGERHGRHRLRLRADAASCAACIPRSCGRSCRRWPRAPASRRRNCTVDEVGRRPSSVPNRASIR